MIPEELRLEVDLLQHLVFYYVIENRALQTQQYGEQKILEYLFHTYFDILKSGSRHTRHILPEDLVELFDEEQEVQQKNGKIFSKDEVIARVVADVISRKTDAEALFMYHRLSGNNPGSFLDLVP